MLSHGLDGLGPAPTAKAAEFYRPAVLTLMSVMSSSSRCVQPPLSFIVLDPWQFLQALVVVVVVVWLISMNGYIGLS